MSWKSELDFLVGRTAGKDHVKIPVKNDAKVSRKELDLARKMKKRVAGME